MIAFSDLLLLSRTWAVGAGVGYGCQLLELFAIELMECTSALYYVFGSLRK